ncbi:MAG: sigma-70 family RNA polymerase sigma factor [Planctomycetes bacterium]|nr:sigma-70 family RNA polymerase sigma factor [Planctomycetota bacterium]
MARDPQALEELNQRLACLPAMVRYQNQRLGGPLDAFEIEEVVRDTTVALWAKLPTFEGRSTLETWAYRFAMLQVLKCLHARARQPAALEVPEEQADLRPTEQAEELPFDSRELQESLTQLSEEAAQVIRLRHWEELSFEAIVARTKLPLNTVKARYYRGLARLKEILERRKRRTA